MADYGYFEHDRGRPFASEMSAAAESFDYGHGGAGESWDDRRDRRRSPVARRGREGGRNGRHEYGRPEPPQRSGLLKTPPAAGPPSSEFIHHHHDFEVDGGRQHHSPPHPHHSRSRSPLLRHVPVPARHEPYYEERRPAHARSRSHEQKQVFENDARGRDYRTGPGGQGPGLLDDPNRHDSRDRGGMFGANDMNDDPYYQHPGPGLLPEPDLSTKRTGNRRSYSPPKSRDRDWEQTDQRMFQDKPLLPDPELEHLRMDPYQSWPSRRSFSPDRDTNFHDRPKRSENRGRQDYKKPSRDSRPALLPEPDIHVPQAVGTEAKKSVQDVLGGFVSPGGGVQNVQMQIQMEQALFQSQEILRNLEQQGQKKEDQKNKEFNRDDTRRRDQRRGVVPKSSNQPRNIITSELDDERKRQIDEDLRRLGIVVGDRSQRTNAPVERPPRTNAPPRNIITSELDAERKRQIDEDLRRLGVVDKQQRTNNPPSLTGLLPTPQSDITSGLLQEPKDKDASLLPPTGVYDQPLYSTGYKPDASDYRSNKDVYSQPAFQNNGGGRQSLLPDPNPASRGQSDGLLPTPDKRRMEDDGSRRKRWKDGGRDTGPHQDRWQQNQPQSRNNNRSTDRHNQGYANNSATNKKDVPKKSTQVKTPQQQQQQQQQKQQNNQPDDDDDDVVEIPAPEEPASQGLMHEEQLIADTIMSRITTLEPSIVASTIDVTPRRIDNQPWKRGMDEKVAESQYKELCLLGDHAKILMFDTILDGLQCYLCPSMFATKKTNKDHEVRYSHKNKLAVVQQKYGRHEPPNEERMKVLQRLASMPTIYGKGGKDGQTLCIRPELVGRDDFYFICRVCHDVFRGPAEAHFRTAVHINLEKRRGKCMPCQIYFSQADKRKTHFSQSLHQKVQYLKQKQRNCPPSQDPVKQPTSSASVQSLKQKQKNSQQSKNTPASAVKAAVAEPKPQAATGRTSTSKTDNKKALASDKVQQSRAKVQQSRDKVQQSHDKGQQSQVATANASSAKASATKESTTKSNTATSLGAVLQSLRDDASSKQDVTGVETKPTVNPVKLQPAGPTASKIASIIKANPNWKGEIRGMNFTSPVAGFFCKVCGKFYNEKRSTREDHCATLPHQLNMKVFLLKNNKDKPLPKWMQNLPSSSGTRKAPAKVELKDNTEVVDMDVDEESSPDPAEKGETSEWFEGDIEEPFEEPW